MFVARLNLAWKALQELGPGQVLHYAWYQTLLHIGYLHWVTRTPSKSIYPSSAKFRHRSFVLRPMGFRRARILGKARPLARKSWRVVVHPHPENLSAR